MRRVFVCIIVALLLCTVLATYCVPTAAAEQGAVSPYADAYTAFTYYANNYSNRTVGTGYELAAAKWLADRLTEWGYTDVGGSTDPADMCVPFTFTYDNSVGYYDKETVTEHSYNVVAYRRCGKADAPLLVIAAPMSNEKEYNLDGEALGYEDAAYSATSVGVLLSVAARLYAVKDLSFDVAFAFFGAEYFYLAGTKEFLKTNTQPLLGAVYLSQVGVGDHLNVYYDEVDTAHGDYMDSLIAKWQFDIAGKPFDPGYYAQVYGGDLPYAHVGISGGNYAFMQEDVPSVHFFGYNWAGGVSSSESATKDDIVFTKDDNVQHFLALYGEDNVKARLGLAAEFVRVMVLSDGDLAAAMRESKAQPSYHGLISQATYQGLRWSLVGAAVVLAVVIACLLMRKSKAAGVPDFSVNSEFVNGRPTEARPADDVFGEYGSPLEGNAADVDREGAESGPSDTNDDNTGNSPDTNDIFGEF